MISLEPSTSPLHVTFANVPCLLCNSIGNGRGSRSNKLIINIRQCRLGFLILNILHFRCIEVVHEDGCLHVPHVWLNKSIKTKHSPVRLFHDVHPQPFSPSPTLQSIPNPSVHPQPFSPSPTLQSIPNPSVHPQPFSPSPTLQSIPNPSVHPQPFSPSPTLQSIPNPSVHPQPFSPSPTLQSIPNPSVHPQPFSPSPTLQSKIKKNNRVDQPQEGEQWSRRHPKKTSRHWEQSPRKSIRRGNKIVAIVRVFGTVVIDVVICLALSIGSRID